MKAKLIINDQEIEFDISKEQLNALIYKQENQTGYERVKCVGDICWYDDCGALHCDNDSFSFIFNRLYESANYYTSKEIAENNIRADKLMRQLRRFAAEHRDKDAPYPSWNICHSHQYYCEELYTVKSNGEIFPFSVYFDTKEIAELAIKTFYDELIWYFTEYENNL